MLQDMKDVSKCACKGAIRDMHNGSLLVELVIVPCNDQL